ncbi:MAG TPA: hypothetical protein VNN19_07660 [bacterium]|nr:hypothetical protein [bacterium]
MTTRAELRAAIRTELNDGGGTPLWSDALLNEFIAQAIRRYGAQLPEEASTTIAVVAGQAAYPLPDRFLRAVRVEQPAGTERVGDGRHPWSYRVFAGQLLLDPAPTQAGSDQEITLDYLRRYAEPAADGDTLATPSADDDVLVALVCARALDELALDESKRQRFSRVRSADPRGVAAAYERRAGERIALRARVLRVGALVDRTAFHE